MSAHRPTAEDLLRQRREQGLEGISDEQAAEVAAALWREPEVKSDVVPREVA